MEHTKLSEIDEIYQAREYLYVDKSLKIIKITSISSVTCYMKQSSDLRILPTAIPSSLTPSWLSGTWD